MKIHILKSATLLAILCATTLSVSALELPQNISSYLESKKLTEDGCLPLLETEGKSFIEFVLANRIEILNNFASLAPNTNPQKLLLAAMEFAAPNDYLETLNKICDLKQTNVIGDIVFEDAFRAAAAGRGFLSYNYQNAQARLTIQRAQTLLPNDPSFQSFLSGILDGSQKIRDKVFFEQNEIPEPELLPQP